MKHQRGQHRGHPAVWATLTIAAFPIVALSLGWAGIDPLRSFGAGALASLMILLIEGVARGRWWIAEPPVARLLGDPEFGSRMLVVLGMLLFVFETFLLASFMTNSTMDGNIVRFVLSRQCASPQSTFMARLCATDRTSVDTDAGTAALREAAEQRFFANGFVTCAARPLMLVCRPEACVQGAMVRCDQWNISRIAGRPISVDSKERIVVAGERVQEDGTYLIDAWADDPESPEWSELGGEDALRALVQLKHTIGRIQVDMQAETFRRAIERLRSR
jgi:hypothetical protein